MKNSTMNSLFATLQRRSIVAMMAVMLFALASCKKALDVDPKDVIRDKNFLRDYWDAEFMLRGAYQAFQNIVEYKFVLGEVQADWVKPGPGADKDLLELASHQVTD